MADHQRNNNNRDPLEQARQFERDYVAGGNGTTSVCPSCSSVIHGSVTVCPDCGEGGLLILNLRQGNCIICHRNAILSCGICETCEKQL